MKKIIALLLSLALALSLAACTPTQEDAPEDTSTPEVTEPADTSTPEQTAPAEPDDQEPQETAETTADTEPTYSFTSVNETVYATSTVNIREGFSADTDKVGSLGKGQSIKRVGIGTGDAEGWSEVEFNGQTAYISSEYLSLTKPAAQSSGSNSGSGSQTSQGSSGGQTQQPSQPSSGQNQSSSSDDDSWKDQYTGGITVIDPDNYNGTNWMEEGTGGSAAGNEWNGEFHDKDEMWEGIQ